MISFSNFFLSTLLIYNCFHAYAASSQLISHFDQYTNYGFGRFNSSSSNVLYNATLTLAMCIVTCHGNPACYGLSYNPTTNDCQLHAVSLDAAYYVRQLIVDKNYRSSVRKMKIEAPYRFSLPNGFPTGSTLTIKGAPLSNASRLQVMLQNINGSERPLYFDIRIAAVVSGSQPGNRTILNTFTANTWGTDQIKNGVSPFVRGMAFEIVIKNFPDAYYIYVNDVFYSAFVHRISFTLIKHVVVTDDVLINDIQVKYETLLTNTYPIPSGFPTGSSITIKGTPNFNASRMQMTLQSLAGSEKALYFDIRIAAVVSGAQPGNRTILNTFITNTWGTDQIKNGVSPFVRGMAFQIVIKNFPDAYYIYVNGVFYSAFVHRISFTLIKQAAFGDDILLSDIQMKYETLLTIPYSLPLPSSFPTGSSVTIKGTSSFNASQIIFALTVANQPLFAGDMPLYFNVRFDSCPAYPNNIVGMNSKQGSWGSQISTSGRLPFDYGVEFELVIENKADAFYMSVDGASFSSFAHRLSTSIIGQFLIQGDVVISSVTVSYP
uniref:Galectin n=1 Tax=Plectus sambesii TaxID=2011161 RepID=A0A914X359_9BILA